MLLFSWWRRQCRWDCGLCCSLVPHLVVIGKREPRGWERNYPSTALPTPDSISSALEWNAGSCDEKPVTNPLSRGTTVVQSRSQRDASECNAPATNLVASTRNLQDIKGKHADQPADKTCDTYRSHVLPLLNRHGWKQLIFRSVRKITKRYY